jgi:hypothetical protein
MKRLLFLLFALLPLSAHAMEITLRPDLAPRLSALQSLYSANYAPRADRFRDASIFHLSGQIVQGDTEKIRTALEGTWGKYLVLESPGGNFLEGIRLGEYIRSILENQDPDIYGIFVLKDGPCLSACALVMALATSTRDIAYGDDSRFVELGAELGFHMGILPEEQATRTVEARQMMNLTYDITQAYTGLIMGGVAPPILLAEALNHRSADSFFYLRGGIRTHAMRLTPVGPADMARAIDGSSLYMDKVNALCRTAFVASPIVRKSFVDFEFGYVDQIDPDKSTLSDTVARLGSRRIAASLNGAGHCIVTLRDDGSLGLDMVDGPAPCQRDGQPWCALPESGEFGPFGSANASVALLADTLGCHAGRLTREGQFWSGDLYRASDTVVPIGWTRSIAQNVNLRAEPSATAARRSSALSAGDEVEILDCAIVDGPHPVWMQVNVDGQTGWFSALFLRPDGAGDLRPVQDGL